MEVETYLLASSLNGIVSQKLARRICPHCMKKRPAIEYEKKLIKANLGIDINELAYAEGCPECVGGYKGRIAIHEVLVINQEIRDAIANEVPKEELRKLVYTGDTKTLLQDGLAKVLQNVTTIEEILRIVDLDDSSTKIVLEGEIKASNVNNNTNNLVNNNVAANTNAVPNINIATNNNAAIEDTSTLNNQINNNINMQQTPSNIRNNSDAEMLDI